jgi:preprotein translocase subunit SecF
MFNFIKHRKKFYIFSGIVLSASIICLAVFGLNFGIDFIGGSILEIKYKEDRPSNQEIKEQLLDFNLGQIYVQPTSETGAILRLKDIDEETHQKIVQKLRENNDLEEQRFESIGPIIGQELKQKTKMIIVFALLAIVLYIAFAFRKIQRPLKSWQYGFAALIALGHDVLIPVGILAVLGTFYGVEISVPIIIALLMVLGYSVNDTVVVFDRVRENLLKGKGDDFEETVDNSLKQTFTRSINTSLTTIFILSALFFFGGETLKPFALVLIVGIIAGTYSSLFLAPPFLVSWLKHRQKI